MKEKINALLLAGSALWCLAMVLAPITGLTVIYMFFSIICHQDAARSWHLYGEQLPVCIRCASIYFGFLISLGLNLPPNVRWLRAAVVLIAVEFVLARLVADVATARALTGIAFGASAAPFVKRGIGELSESM